ncbi:MAG: sn-glycerol-3-phosphate ABC transporter ATP-binding protein UgpC [Pusillimonas sp.]
MSSITINDLKKNFDATPVIRGISLDIRDGEFIALVGPSGCGKSTLLRIIAGLESQDSGEIRLGDRLINDAAPKDRNIAMVFQNYALYPHMTVAQNLGFSLRLQGAKAAHVKARTSEVAQALGLSPLMDRYPRQLSGGQRQRVAMGRAIVRDPQAFLFDEPLSNLDAKLRVQMRTEIKALHQRLGTTTVYVTHDQVEAMTMADRIVVLRGGLIEQVGEPLALYDRPDNAFVAGFIGSPAMNFIAGRLDLLDAPRLVTDDGLQLPVGPVPQESHGREVIYGIRPEHFVLGDEHGASSEVVVVEPTGSETQIAVRLAGREIMTAFRDRLNAYPGQRISLTPQLHQVHLFDAGDGRRIN